MTPLPLALARVAGVVAAAGAAGWVIVRALLPPGRPLRLERLGWAFAVGVGLLESFVPLSFLVGSRPGWMSFGTLCAFVLVLSRLVPPLSPPSPPAGGSGELKRRDVPTNLPLPAGAVQRDGSPVAGNAGRRPAVSGRGEGALRLCLRLLIVGGVALYALRALTEPMWSNDFVAIWGLKGKAIFLAGGMPERRPGFPGFSHPEYPLGLPFLYAGVAFLTRGWDDHALALLFPLFQIATLCVAAGWLRRRGAAPAAALLAAAILASFEPLYSAFLTGLAEVPLAFAALLFGTALADAFDPAEQGALRRLALAAAILAATKNEGLFLAAAGCALGLALGGRRRWKLAAAALPTALLVHLLHRLWRGSLPLRDFDFGLFSVERLRESLAAAASVVGPLGGIGLALVAALVALGGRRRDADAMLALPACAAAAYLLLPAFAVRGPEWMVQTTLTRIVAALAPLAAAAIALRFARTGAES